MACAYAETLALSSTSHHYFFESSGTAPGLSVYRRMGLDASLANGTAGYVFAAWRRFRASADRSDLQAAERFMSTMLRPGNGSAMPPAGRGSLLYGAAGIYFAAALVHCEWGNRRAAVESTREFLHAAEDAAGLDATFGIASTLIGGTILHHRLRADAVTVDELEDFLAGHASRILRRLHRAGIDALELPVLGLAHGAAGVIYAIARVTHELHLPVPGALESALKHLCERPEDANAEAWARKSLCNGAAGMVKFWLSAWRLLRQQRFLDLARRSAFEAGQVHECTGPSLCCGLSGRALSLLEVYEETGERMWLARACGLRDAAMMLPKDEQSGLLKGALGVELTSVLLDSAAKSEQVNPLAARTT